MNIKIDGVMRFEYCCFGADLGVCDDCAIKFLCYTVKDTLILDCCMFNSSGKFDYEASTFYLDRLESIKNVLFFKLNDLIIKKAIDNRNKFPYYLLYRGRVLFCSYGLSEQGLIRKVETTDGVLL
jgi:hypothetical protein